MAKYKIINNTIKPPKLDPVTGKDKRNWTEKLGHGVQFKSPTGELIRVDANRPRITDYLTEGMLRLQRGEFIKIEEITDVNEVLKKHTLTKGSKLSSILEPEEIAANSIAHNAAGERSRATAVEMGKDTTVARGEGYTVNPDGEPNFSVTAAKDMKKRVRTMPEAPASAPEVAAT